MKKTAAYMLVTDENTILYPPLLPDVLCDFFIVTNIQNLNSKYWNIKLIPELNNIENDIIENPNKYLGDYVEYIRIYPEQVIAGKLSEDKECVYTIPSIESLLPLDTQLIEPQPLEKPLSNPVYTDGPYNGYPLQLSICVPISNRCDTLHKCLDGLKPLLDSLDAELIVVDSSTDGSTEIAKKYGGKIIPFTWVNDFSAARNVAIREAKGAWILSIDDDEWFDNTDEIIKFFKGDQWLKCDVAFYKIRNYTDIDGKAYDDFYAQRMAKNHPSLHYIYEIHECFDLSFLKDLPYSKYFSNYAHHFGYAYKTDEDRENKIYRNISGLYTALKASPLDLRLHYQLCSETTSIYKYNDTICLCFKLLALCKIHSDHQNKVEKSLAFHWARITMLYLYTTAQIIGDEEIFQRIYNLTNFKDFNCFQLATIHYFLLTHAINLQNYKEACKYAEEYYKLRTEYLNAPSKPTLSNSITMDLVEPQRRYNTVLTLHAFSLILLQKENEAEKIISHIDFSSVDDNDKILLGKIFYLCTENIFLKYFNADEDIILNMYKAAKYNYLEKRKKGIKYSVSLSEAYYHLYCKFKNALDISSEINKSIRINPYVNLILLLGEPSNLQNYDYFCTEKKMLNQFVDELCVPAALNNYDLKKFTKHLDFEGIQQMIRIISKEAFQDFNQIYINYIQQLDFDSENNKPSEELSLKELYLFTGILESYLLNTDSKCYNELKDESYLKYFKSYIKLLNIWTITNYNLQMLSEINLSMVPSTSRGVIYLNKALEHANNKKLCVEYIKKAVSECPIFDKGAKLLLEYIVKSDSEARKDMPVEKPKTEFELLGEQLKQTAKQLIEVGNLQEAQNILLQLETLLPGDTEVRSLLARCKA